MLETFLRDLRYGARALTRTPAFTLAAVLTLAIGIGASTAVYSVLRGVLLAPLPYDHPERRVMIWSRWTAFDKTWISDAELFDYRMRCRTLSQVAAGSPGQGNMTGDGDPIRVGVGQVTANTFSVLGSEALLGRTFLPEEDRPGGSTAVVVVSHGLWQHRYGGDPDLVGRTLQLDGVAHAVVGVMPPGFELPTDYNVNATEPTQLWLPLALDPERLERDSHGYYAAAELAATATLTSRPIRAVFTRRFSGMLL